MTAKDRQHISPQKIASFRRIVYKHYKERGRRFAWRSTREPYEILVSEFMLQQTQTERVAPKYERFLERFPNFHRLAEAPLREVLEMWQGLGYNRRAKALRETARAVVTEYHGNLPSDTEALLGLPGVGPATAAAIAAFAFNQPAILLETNIRRVFIHLFFQDDAAVRDNQIVPLIDATLDRSNPREWYYALMDYGVMLKKSGPNANRKSYHYQRQPPFHGSNRQLRGKILKALIQKKMTASSLSVALSIRADELEKPLKQLLAEGIITRKGRLFAPAE